LHALAGEKHGETQQRRDTVVLTNHGEHIERTGLDQFLRRPTLRPTLHDAPTIVGFFAGTIR